LKEKGEAVSWLIEKKNELFVSKAYNKILIGLNSKMMNVSNKITVCEAFMTGSGEFGKILLLHKVIKANRRSF